jgi:uncharacterized protein DUF4417
MDGSGSNRMKKLGIPELSKESEVDLELPKTARVWRSVAQASEVDCWLFYVDDYRFESLWNNPEKVVATGAPQAVELNFSVFEDSPAALAIWNTYRKRVVSKVWQEAGLKVWIDLCFPGTWSGLVLAGVPRGWQRYATRGFDSRVDDLERELEWARVGAAGRDFRLMVYGGGAKVKAWCSNRSQTFHVPHYSDARKRLGEGTRRRLRRQGSLT